MGGDHQHPAKATQATLLTALPALMPGRFPVAVKTTGTMPAMPTPTSPHPMMAPTMVSVASPTVSPVPATRRAASLPDRDGR